MAKSDPPKPNKLHELSAPILLFIHSLPKIVFPLVTAGIMLGGLFATNSVVGGVLLLVLGLILGWLIALSWRLLTPSAQVVRSIMLVVVVGYGLARLFGGY